MKAELKPCPFCGNKASLFKKTLDERFAYAEEIKVQCNDCNVVMVGMGDTSKGGYADNSKIESQITSKWNRRVDS